MIDVGERVRDEIQQHPRPDLNNHITLSLLNRAYFPKTDFFFERARPFAFAKNPKKKKWFHNVATC